jgi:hypothetical protein
MFKPNSQKRRLLRVAKRLAISNISIRSKVNEMEDAINRSIPKGYQLANPKGEGRVVVNKSASPFVAIPVGAPHTSDDYRQGGGGWLPT